VLAWSALVLAACGQVRVPPTSVPFSSATPVEATAGTWQTWLVGSVTALRPPAPPASFSQQASDELAALVARAAARTPAILTNIDTWNLGACKAWNELQRALIVSRKPAPPLAARGFALVSTAMYDAMVVAFDAKYAYLRARPNALAGGPSIYGPQEDSPSYVSTRAAISAAAAAVLKQLFPLDVAAIDAELLDATNADLDSGTQFQSDVDAGHAIGNAVAALALARKATDHGDDPQPTYTASGLPGRWAPGPGAPATPPVLAGWGSVTTWVLPTGSSVRPAAPPPYGLALWNAQRDDVLNVNLTLTTERKAIATFWADGGGTVTPPGHWCQIAVDEGFSRGLNDCRMARMLALLGVAQHDAFVACWECKYHYDIARPVTEIRATVAGQGSWSPFIVTPHFPSYPSGHSTTSGAASQVLGALFPDKAITFATMATEAKDSRLYGGIHYRFDNDAGLDMGRIIGGLVADMAAHDGSQ
jgi:membrane-associated phospholipid phosphatase